MKRVSLKIELWPNSDRLMWDRLIKEGDHWMRRVQGPNGQQRQKEWSRELRLLVVVCAW